MSNFLTGLRDGAVTSAVLRDLDKGTDRQILH
jgi:hypothetical protein